MKKFFLTIGLITLVVCAAWAYNTWSNYWKEYQKAAELSKLNEDVANLFDVLQQYKGHMGVYPAGNNADIARTLNGNNSRSLIILVGHKQTVNAKGEFVDPWGTPYKIYFAGDSILIRSAGPNKHFDDTTVQNSDDIFRSN